VAGTLLQNRVAGPAVWEAMSAEWEATLAHVPPAMQSRLVTGLPSLIGDEALAERITAFHRSHPIAVAQEFVDRAVERMRNGVAFANRARPLLGTALGAVA
jgi:DNA-binding transcriptional LysR family regulator